MRPQQQQRPQQPVKIQQQPQQPWSNRRLLQRPRPAMQPLQP
jgi:hypothetical protein